MGQCMSRKGLMVTGRGWKTLGHNILRVVEVEVWFQISCFSLESVCLISCLYAAYIPTHTPPEPSSSIPVCVCVVCACPHSLNAARLVFLQPAATCRHISALFYFCCRTVIIFIKQVNTHESLCSNYTTFIVFIVSFLHPCHISNVKRL